MGDIFEMLPNCHHSFRVEHDEGISTFNSERHCEMNRRSRKTGNEEETDNEEQRDDDAKLACVVLFSARSHTLVEHSRVHGSLSLFDIQG